MFFWKNHRHSQMDLRDELIRLGSPVMIVQVRSLTITRHNQGRVDSGAEHAVCPLLAQ